VVVQPGIPGPFNDYRIPSKLPEFFAMGIPVILPRSNVGLLAKNADECLLLDRGDTPDVVEKLVYVLENDALRQRLARGARGFAERMFSWRRSAERLSQFYEKILRTE
jgi:glycosyltransferase involved in cell wall biosynthesis